MGVKLGIHGNDYDVLDRLLARKCWQRDSHGNRRLPIQKQRVRNIKSVFLPKGCKVLCFGEGGV